MLEKYKQKDDVISEIIKLELEITLAISQGHKPHVDDQFKKHRKKLTKLRKSLKIC